MRFEDLEAIRSDDRRATEQAVAGLREKVDAATARATLLEEEVATARTCHVTDSERMVAELEAARARIEEMNQQIAEHRELEHALRRSVLDAEDRAREAERARADRPGVVPPPAVVATEPEPVPRVERDEPRVDQPQPVGAGVGSGAASPPPSDLRRGCSPA